MTDHEFFTACEQHDWYFEFADDHRSWERGRASKLIEQAKADPHHADMMEAFERYAFSGERFGTPKAEKPTRDRWCRPVPNGVSGIIPGQVSLLDLVS